MTGRGAYDLIARRFKTLKQAAALLKSSIDEVPHKVESLQDEIDGFKKEISSLRQQIAFTKFNVETVNVDLVAGLPVFATKVPDADMETMRLMGDQYRQKYTAGTAIFANDDGKLLAVLGDDLVKRGYKASDLITAIGGRGGGRPNMAQGSLPDASHVDEALSKVPRVVQEKLK